MRIVKSINSNVALAVDSTGGEAVVFGKGIGFHAVPYEIGDDDSRVQKRFYEVNTALLPMMETLSEDALFVSSEIVDLARESLGCVLNPNLPFTLADHIQFAISCAKDGVVIENPLAAEIGIVYPRETAIGMRGVEIARERCGIELPRTEGHAMALHIVNAEAPASEGSSTDLVMKSTPIIDEIISIAEKSLGTTIDREVYPYTRFVTHLRFLIGRLMNPGSAPQGETSATASVLPRMEKDFPRAARCAASICSHLCSAYGWSCSDEERLYLLLHTNQFITGQ